MKLKKVLSISVVLICVVFQSCSNVSSIETKKPATPNSLMVMKQINYNLLYWGFQRADSFHIHWDTIPFEKTEKFAVIRENYFLHENIENGHYYYRVSCFENQIESELSEMVDIISDFRPEPPINVKVMDYKEDIMLYWDNAINVISYNVYYNGHSGINKNDNKAEVMFGTSVIFKGIESDCYFRVEAVNKFGISDLSKEVKYTHN